MNRPNLLLILLFSTNFIFCQTHFYVGARSNSMANASVALFDVYAYHNNPGAIAVLNTATAGVSYENRFLLKDFQKQGIAIALPVKIGVVSFGAQLSGYDALRTRKVGAGYSFKLTEKLFTGIQFNYHTIRFSDNYVAINSFTGEFGLYTYLTNQCRLGVSVYNLGRSKVQGFKNEACTTLMRLGLVYELSPQILFSIESEKDLFYQLRCKGAFEYKPLKNFFFRGGIASQPNELTFGFGYKIKLFQFDIGSSFHQFLGWSPHFSFTYSFDKKS